MKDPHPFRDLFTNWNASGPWDWFCHLFTAIFVVVGYTILGLNALFLLFQFVRWIFNIHWPS